MTSTRRSLIALLLLLTLPLRVLGAVAMPCCPFAATAVHHESMQGSMEGSMDSDPMSASMAARPMSSTSDDAPRHVHPDSTCCAIALMASSPPAIAPRGDGPPVPPDEGVAPVAAFVTDPPERPPRSSILPA